MTFPEIRIVSKKIKIQQSLKKFFAFCLFQIKDYFGGKKTISPNQDVPFYIYFEENTQIKNYFSLYIGSYSFPAGIKMILASYFSTRPSIAVLIKTESFF